MRRSIATISLSGPLEEKLAAAARAGFDAVEIFEGDLITSPLSPADVRLRTADLGLAILLYQPFRDFEAVPETLFQRNLRRAERKFELMASLGADMLLVCSNISAAAIDDDALAADQLWQLAERAAGHGIRIAYEALAWGRHISGYERAWKLVDRVAHPRLGLCLDSFHILSLGHDPAAIRQIPAEKIFFLQLADAPLLNMDTLAWSRHYRCFPGQGGFDMTGFMADVLASGYSGPWSLEVFNDVFRQADAERTAVDGMRSLLALEEALALRPGLSPGPVTLAGLPAPVDLTGYAFIELAVDGLMEPVTEYFLHGMGFARTGRHRSKPVQLWQQAGARILVNRTRADDPGQPHGHAAVSAIAVESRNPVRSAQRAQALRAPAIPRSVGPGEADLPAVTAPDGTTLFFCQTDASGHAGWAGDFEPVPEPPQRRPLLTAVDHVALSQPFDYFDEAVLFYRSLLGMHSQPNEEVASPYGLVRSRAVRSVSGGVRLVLNVPLLGGGRLAETATYQHVAFSCGDIFAAAQAMRSAGIPTLPIPDNYYSDLIARFDLTDELADRLRQSGVLYDRDARGGEFFHFYTAVLGRRLFFEIVQRTGGYDGFGAFNTPVRMAAQLHYAAAGRLQLARVN
ncbi:MAG: sugar phosphate isomerase/epimerase and 4-hydroxyphenylpyruvate domain-containing protein [Streptosporangiaceae bacterium]|nr:sugar phosphate isomerase/epimerase and 4-hydroxyphenylpyruvate domain-containing protein [Streptosporangiaceae bacterium]